MDISTKSTDDDHDHDDDIVIALYSTGIKVTNRDPQWMQQEKWHIKKKKKKKGYQNTHCCCKYKNQQRNTRFFRSYR
ncbi:MAG TPA: hypothetical protein VM660_01050 [Bacillus sp. (in: firmicutes)]|nr:hypothetical protein [Bacillus sp. (in: firmicutes)]